jgi:hypothetical protein
MYKCRQKTGWATFRAIISQTHRVTLVWLFPFSLLYFDVPLFTYSFFLSLHQYIFFGFLASSLCVYGQRHLSFVTSSPTSNDIFFQKIFLAPKIVLSDSIVCHECFYRYLQQLDGRVARFFSVQLTRTGKSIPNDHKTSKWT